MLFNSSTSPWSCKNTLYVTFHRIKSFAFVCDAKWIMQPFKECWRFGQGKKWTSLEIVIEYTSRCLEIEEEIFKLRSNEMLLQRILTEILQVSKERLWRKDDSSYHEIECRLSHGSAWNDRHWPKPWLCTQSKACKRHAASRMSCCQTMIRVIPILTGWRLKMRKSTQN